MMSLKSTKTTVAVQKNNNSYVYVLSLLLYFRFSLDYQTRQTSRISYFIWNLQFEQHVSPSRSPAAMFPSTLSWFLASTAETTLTARQTDNDYRGSGDSVGRAVVHPL